MVRSHHLLTHWGNTVPLLSRVGSLHSPDREDPDQAALHQDMQGDPLQVTDVHLQVTAPLQTCNSSNRHRCNTDSLERPHLAKCSHEGMLRAHSN